MNLGGGRRWCGANHLRILGRHALAELDEDVGVEGSLGTAFDGPFSKAPPHEWLGSPAGGGGVLVSWRGRGWIASPQLGQAAPMFLQALCLDFSERMTSCSPCSLRGSLG